MAVTVACAIVAIAVLPPVFAVGLELVKAKGALSLLANPRLWLLLLRSLTLSTAVTLLALAVGVPLGVLFARAAFPFRKMLLAAHVAIVFLPPFLPALGWFHLFGSEGFVGSDFTARILFSEAGAVLVMASCFAPIVTALTALGIRGVSPSLEESGRIVAGPWRTAAFISVPCAAPAIALASIIVFTLSLSELGVPMFLRVDVYPTIVFSRLGGMDFAPGEAALFVLPLVLVTFALLWIEQRFASHRAIAVLGGRTESRSPLFSNRPWIVGVAALAAIISALPLIVLVFQAVTRGGFSEIGSWVGSAPWNGLRASASAAAVMTTVALVMGRELARKTRAGAWLDGLSTVAFILPSSILGVGIVAAWNHSATNWLYGSCGILVVGFVARYSAVVTRVFAGAVAQVPTSLEDAARTVGAGYLRRLMMVAQVAPRGLVGAFALSFVFAMRDIETTALFYPPGGEPLTVRIFTLEANGPPGVVSALAVLHIGMTFAALAIAWLFLRARSAT